MNEVTFTGNVSRIHGTRYTQAGDIILGFDLAVDNGYFDRNRNRWISGTRFRPVMAYRQLAENAAVHSHALGYPEQQVSVGRGDSASLRSVAGPRSRPDRPTRTLPPCVPPTGPCRGRAPDRHQLQRRPERWTPSPSRAPRYPSARPRGRSPRTLVRPCPALTVTSKAGSWRVWVCCAISHQVHNPVHLRRALNFAPGRLP